MKNLKVLFVYTNCMLDNLIPVGASSVLGALRGAGIDVELFDTTFYRTEERSTDVERTFNLQVLPVDYASVGISVKTSNMYKDFRDQVIRLKPQIIMFSAVEVTYWQCVALLDCIKDIKPYIVVGGIFAMLSPDEVIANDCIDAICIGEGEDAIVEFCQKFVNGKDFSDTSGMWFKRENNIIKNSINHLVDLERMKFLDFTLYEDKRFYKPIQGRIFRMVPLEFSRGCPYRCSYCANYALERLFESVGRWYRWKSLNRIFAEIDEYVNKYKVEFFYFVSESFLSMPHKKIDEFCERYADYKIPFWFNTRPETITREALKKLENINCFRMSIGLDHGNEEFRRKMLNRKVSNKKIIEACKIVEDTRISYALNNMIGFPGETRELIFDTISLNRKVNPDTVAVFIFAPFKGCELYNYCLRHGYITSASKARDPNKESMLEHNTLSGDEINGLLRTFPLYVHFGKGMFSLIGQAERFTEKGNKIFYELSEKYKKEHFYPPLRPPDEQAGVCPPLC